MKIRIANWNLERPKKGSKKTNLAIRKLNDIDAEILILTETSNAVDLSTNYPFSIKSKPYSRTPDEQWVTIWSKYEIIKEIETLDKHRTVCGIIKTPFGNIVVYGTIIPYHMAGVKGLRYGELGYKAWEYHEKDIYKQSNNWRKIIQNEKLPLIVMGDFNQTRIGNIGYGTKKVRKLLSEKLEETNLKCITEIDFSINFLSPDPKTGKIRKNIDHICLSKDLLTKIESYNVGAWNHFDNENNYMSDHNGVYADLKIKTSANKGYK